MLAGLASVLEVCTLTKLTPTAEGNLVDRGARVRARDEPNLLARVEADLVRVVPI
jgi:hypothetical protein